MLKHQSTILLRKEILASLILTLMIPFLCAQEGFEFRFEDESSSTAPGDSYYTQTLAFRFRNGARQILPRHLKGLPAEILCTFNVPPPGGKGSFRAENQAGKHRLEIYLPERFPAWSEDPEKLERMSRWTLLSRLGLTLEQQKRVPASWFFAGAARRTASDSWKLRNLKFGKYPAAYAFASHGIFPGLRDIVQVTPAASDGFSRAVYEEWAQILFEQCVRSGAARNGLMEQYLAQLYGAPDQDQYALFTKVFYSHLEVYGKRKFGRFVQTDGIFDLDKWFQREAEKQLLSRFLPMSVVFLETSYRQAVKLTVNEKGSRKETTILAFASALRGKPDLNMQVQLSETLVRLTELLYSSAPQITNSFSALINEITHLRDIGGSPESAGKIAEAEKKFLHALEIQSLRENILKDAERRLIPPGERRSLSFSDYGYSEKITDPALEILDNYLKRSEKK